MSLNFKVSGVWKKTAPYVKVNGVWKQCSEVYINKNGSWKPVLYEPGILKVSAFDDDTVWIAPPGVFSITFEVVGGDGGSGGKDANWGHFGYTGTKVTGTLEVRLGTKLYLASGNGGGIGDSDKNGAIVPNNSVYNGVGGYGGAGYWNGGTGGAPGTKGTSGGGGGGGAASIIMNVDKYFNFSPIVVAGGGGGGAGGGRGSTGAGINSKFMYPAGATGGEIGGHGYSRTPDDGGGGGGGGSGYPLGGVGGYAAAGDQGGFSGDNGQSYVETSITHNVVTTAGNSSGINGKGYGAPVYGNNGYVKITW